MADSIYKERIREVLLAELVSIRAAKKPERQEDYPFDNSVPYINLQTLETGVPSRFAEKAGSIISGKDLVIVKDGYRSGKVFYAKEGVAASTLAILSPMSNEVQIDYLYCYLSYCYDEFQNKLKGEIIRHLDMSYLKQLTIPLPDVSKQREIAEKYLRFESLVNEMKSKASHLKELSIKLKNKELKNKSEILNQHATMILKSWLYQMFKKAV